MCYGVVARSFHWITVVIVLIMIPVGLTMTQEIPKQVQNPLFVLHKGLGSMFLVLILLRLAWRAFNPPPLMPASMPRVQRLAAEFTHVALYVLLLTMAVSGYVRVTTGGFPIEWLNAVGIPPLLPKMEGVSKIASSVHDTTKTFLILVILLHIAAASYHGLVRRDGVFARMWPPLAR